MEKYNADVYGDISKQVRTLINRYNMLVSETEALQKECAERDEKVEALKEEIGKKIEELKSNIEETSEGINHTDAKRKEVSKDFRSLVKKDAVARVERRIDNLKFEEMISREEFYRKSSKQWISRI